MVVLFAFLIANLFRASESGVTAHALVCWVDHERVFTHIHGMRQIGHIENWTECIANRRGEPLSRFNLGWANRLGASSSTLIQTLAPWTMRS